MSVLVTSGNLQDVIEMIHLLKPGQPVAVDCETTGLFPYEQDTLRGVSFAFEIDGRIYSFYVPVVYPGESLPIRDQVALFTALCGARPYWIFHHGKFDFAFLRQLPLSHDGDVFFPFPEPHEWWDTKVVNWLLDENLPTGLKESSVRHFGEDSDDCQLALPGAKRLKSGRVSTTGVKWDQLTLSDIKDYASMDAELTLRLYHLQKDLINSPGNPQVLGDIRPAIERELAIQATLFRIERRGILVNGELIESMRHQTERGVVKIERAFHEIYPGLNINSPVQLAKWLYDDLGLEPPSKTKSGARSTNRDALEQLQDQHEHVAALLKHRRLKKALTGYLVPLTERTGYDGRVHPSFSITGTVTGRFSCSNPNLQTIPRADTLAGVRDVFIAEDGFELWEYDLSAAELRVMAGMADEERLISSLEEGRDMHSENAGEIFGPNFTPLQRRSAKNIMYGWAYGLTRVETAVKYISGMTKTEAAKVAERVLAGLKRIYPNIYRMMNRTSREADRKGILPVNEAAWPGRFRHFRTDGRRAPAYTAFNALIQGGIGEFMKDVMLIAEDELAAVGARICLQVHDSLVIEVPIGMGMKVQEILQAVADDVNPFAMRMIFDASPWEAHD
jgi:DNA polymerase-1